MQAAYQINRSTINTGKNCLDPIRLERKNQTNSRGNLSPSKPATITSFMFLILTRKMFSIAMKIKRTRRVNFRIMNENQRRAPSTEVKTTHVTTRNSLFRKLRQETNLQIKIYKLRPYRQLSFSTLNLTTKICKMKVKKLRHSSQCKNKP